MKSYFHVLSFIVLALSGVLTTFCTATPIVFHFDKIEPFENFSRKANANPIDKTNLIENGIVFKKGTGTYRWFGFKIYDATLFVADNFSGDISQRPMVLEIQYDIDIDQQDLIETTEEEWSELTIYKAGFCEAKQQWLKQLSHIWPDLESRDRLRMEAHSNGWSDFYLNEKYLGRIIDKSFSTCFLSIWLAEDTSEPALRRSLLGIE